MSATEDKLGALHDALAEYFTEQITSEGGMSAAMAAQINQFLKNNSITCAPSQDNATGELQRKVEEQRAARAANRKRHLTAVPDAVDTALAAEQMQFITSHG